MKGVVTFAGSGGGMGKTLSVTELAVWASQYYPVSVIDVDPLRIITVFNANRMRHKETGFKMYDLEQCLTDMPDAADLSDAFHTLIREELDEGILFVDLPGVITDLNLFIMAYSDLIIAPCSDSPQEQVKLIDFDKRLVEFGQSLNTELQVMVLPSRMRSHAHKKLQVFRTWINESLECMVPMESAISLRSEYTNEKAFTMGEGIAERMPFSDAAREIENTGKEIMNAIRSKRSEEKRPEPKSA